MISIVKEHMEIVHLAEDAIRAQGIEPVTEPIRGGTDGAQLTFKGLPCPNLGTGGYGYHGPYEHVTVEAMETVVKILKHIMTHVA
jgi:tripeptide aminopeptidase